MSSGLVVDRVDPLRLLEVAQAVLDAADAMCAHPAAPAPYMPRLLIAGDLPDSLLEFDWWELTEASDFLVRMGLLDNPSGPMPRAACTKGRTLKGGLKPSKWSRSRRRGR
jgi:hypothetical protein